MLRFSFLLCVIFLNISHAAMPKELIKRHHTNLIYNDLPACFKAMRVGEVYYRYEYFPEEESFKIDYQGLSDICADSAEAEAFVLNLLQLSKQKKLALADYASQVGIHKGASEQGCIFQHYGDFWHVDPADSGKKAHERTAVVFSSSSENLATRLFNRDAQEIISEAKRQGFKIKNSHDYEGLDKFVSGLVRAHPEQVEQLEEGELISGDFTTFIHRAAFMSEVGCHDRIFISIYTKEMSGTGAAFFWGSSFVMAAMLLSCLCGT